MSEVASRPTASRGRGSGRGGRGGFAGRGGRKANGDKSDHKLTTDDTPAAFEDDGELTELRKLYGDKTSVIREMFPDWSEIDVLFALQETNGDQTDAVTRIADGTMAQWGEVSKAKKISKSKTREAPSAIEQPAPAVRAGRGGRGASEGGRGRGRATERGGRNGRGRSAHPTSDGQRHKETQQLSVPTKESPAWGEDESKGAVAASAILPASDNLVHNPESSPATVAQQKTWASMLRQSTAPKAVPKSQETLAPTTVEPVQSQVAELQLSSEPDFEPELELELERETDYAEQEQETTPIVEAAVIAQTPPAIIEPEIALPPPKDELTKVNLEQVVDESQPPSTVTAASTAADSWDPRQPLSSTTATPLSAAQHQYQNQRAAGFAATAAKATAERVNSRNSSFQRQKEAVRMPGNRELNSATVQFGAFNLGDDEDVDGDREEPETRAQPPADSPLAHPRTSLPPVAQPTSAMPEPLQQKPTSGPPGIAPVAPTAASQGPLGSQPSGTASQFNRFGQSGTQDANKPLDPFSQQSSTSTQAPFDTFSNSTSQPPSGPSGSAYSSAPGDYSSYYSSGQQDRNAYNNYYGGHFGQHSQEGLSSQQRGSSGYNGTQNDSLSQYPQSGSGHTQPRFGPAASAGDIQNSGHSTPNPASQAQQQQQQQQGQNQQGQQTQQQAGPGGPQQPSHGQQYPGYSHPYYNSPYYNQYYSGYGQGGYPYGKNGMYGQPYGVSPNGPYDHASSPASFAHSSLHRDSGIGSSIGDYGRTGSGQGGAQSGLSGGFGSSHDSFSRGASSFQTQNSAFNTQSQQSGAGSTDDLKPFGDSKAGSGPSPSLGGARPGSATNTGPNAQGGLPPQGSQTGSSYGGYPSHLQGQHGVHGNSGYSMGGTGTSGSHGNTPYGSYGQGGFGGSGYYSNQQRGGWGGNYH